MSASEQLGEDALRPQQVALASDLGQGVWPEAFGKRSHSHAPIKPSIAQGQAART